MSAVTTHVLDTARGRPAAGVPVRLERLQPGPAAPAGGTELLAQAVTDADGRVSALGPDRVEPGTYRITFDTASYYSGSGQSCFFPEVGITFTLADSAEHYHVPLLLSPFAYSTYRGS
jgi:5-hydroxyisourate hydrolase